jgi:hypothetical protein
LDPEEVGEESGLLVKAELNEENLSRNSMTFRRDIKKILQHSGYESDQDHLDHQQQQAYQPPNALNSLLPETSSAATNIIQVAKSLKKNLEVSLPPFHHSL